MAFINIYTNNLTRQLRNTEITNRNWVFVPGTTITGSPDVIYEFTSLRDFLDTCGSYGPEGSLTHTYISGILSAGLPVLFKRITKNDLDPENVKEVKKAKTVFSHTDAATEEEVVDFEVYEKFGGTYGNNLYITLRDTGSAIWIDVNYNKLSTLESKRIITYNSTTETRAQINEKLIAALQSVNTESGKIIFDRIDIVVKNTDTATFTFLSEKNRQLQGGEDLDEDYVSAMIPQVYDYENGPLKDKMLYQPEFLTSGGYTDTIASTTNPIATAMKNLSLYRQDCRALIDLPVDLDKTEQLTKARELVYQQASNTQVIPSASICAPWCYMQVGSLQEWMPPSYVYLTVVGNALNVNNNAIYAPKAGLAFGRIQNIIKPQFEIGSDICEAWQTDGDAQINPIMKVQSGSYVIMGNSTLLMKDTYNEEENAFSESSADLTIIEIKRYVYNLATELQYRYNSAESFETFALSTATYLNQMKSVGAVTQYDIVNISSSDEPRKLKVLINVYLSPTIKNIEIYLNVSYGTINVSSGGVE